MATTRALASRTDLDPLYKMSRIKSKHARDRFLDKHSELINQATVVRLGDLVREKAKTDVAQVIPLAETAIAIALRTRDREALAHSLRTKGNALYLCGQNRPAAQSHQKAAEMFAKLGNASERARTLSASIQPLILMGQYDRAFAAAEQARKIFAAEGNQWRLARLELNTGNIFHRQDRFSEALDHYQRAYRFLATSPEKDTEALGVASHNVAMCLVGLNDFPGALAAHEEARRFALEHGMHALVGQADYNIASLYYLRGEHSRAIEMLRSTLETCRKANDQYHVALCHLDLSEIYLELNQGKEAAQIAQQAEEDFRRLEMGYEAGKALGNLALAMWQQDQTKSALQLFDKARKIFVKEKNRVWPSRIDLYRATILLHQRQYRKALFLCFAALKAFQSSKIPYSLIVCRLLIAHLHLQRGKTALALRHANAAYKTVQPLELPTLLSQTQLLMGRIRAKMGQQSVAYDCYQSAREILEAQRTGLSREELRTSFMRNRLEVYEGLVELCLAWKPERRLGEAFEHIEQSKSRSLRDLMQKSGSEFHLTSDLDPKLTRKIEDLRAEISWYSHKYEAEQREAKEHPERLAHIQSEIRKREDDLLRAVREMPFRVAESAGLVTPKAVTVDQIRSFLPPGSTLLEYFQLRDQFAAVVLSRDSLEILPLAPVSLVKDAVTRLHFQLSKFHLGPEYVHQFDRSSMESTLRHLSDLHDALVAPIRTRLKGNRLFVAPHGILHSLPFQALFDGRQYLIDSFGISYAPSATILSLCSTRTTSATDFALVLGIPDAAAPLVLDEVKTVAGTLPESGLFLGELATAKLLRDKGQRSRFIHIATHGYFRQDNPMFSGIRLGDGVLSVYDLYQMKLPAELITLSGCATGLSVVADGDEQLGLLRGLIYAGAKSAMLTLWDVQDRSTADFMASFYSLLSRGEEKTAALRLAALKLRQTHPHPYYWAPFALFGE